MSTAAERIHEARERDLAKAETEQPDEAEEAETEGEPAPTPEVPETEPQEPAAEPETPQGYAGLTAEQTAELNKAYESYAKRVAKALHGELPPDCPTCNGLGFDMTGGQGAPEFRLHDQYKGCDDCDGLGKVKTGSQVMGHDLTDCPKCQGRGYLERLPVPTAVPPQPEEYGTPAWMGTVTPNIAP